MNGVATISDIEAIEQVPLSERRLPFSTYAAIQAGANKNPDKIALQFFLQATNFKDAVFFTYKDVMGLINQAANMFHSLGIEKNDVVSVILPNLPQSYFAIWGAEAAGIVNPINPMLEPEVMVDIMNAAGAKVLVTLAYFPTTDIWHKVASIADQVPTLETILTVDLANYLGFLPRMGLKFINFRADKGPKVRAKVADFGLTARPQPADKLISGRTIQPDDIAAYFHTGGTTGTPKLAQQTHYNEVFDAWSAAISIDLSENKILYCGLPLFHVNGVILTGLIPWMFGASVVLGTPAGFRAEGVFPNFWQIVDHYKINFFSGVPTVYSTLLNFPIEENDISSLEFAICGAAPMPVEVFRQFEERTSVRILEGYGLTEGACVSSVNPIAGERRVGSIGLRLPYQEMKTVQLGPGGQYERDCKTNEIGVIIVRGPNVFIGYKQQRDNKEAWVDTGDGLGLWLNTGDLGRMDEDGYFWLTGRKKELIIRGGHNIDPQLIEEPLVTHPAVALAAAVGRPDARVGELPVAYVELNPDAAAVTEADLLDFAAAQIGERAAVPKAIHIVAEMPQTAVGKIFKPELVWREVKDVYTTAVQEIDGVTEVNVDVGPDKLYGMAAAITVTKAPDADKSELQDAIAELLGQYAVHYYLTLK